MATRSRSETAIGNARVVTDWAVWLPKAFFMNWSDRANWEKNLSDPTLFLPLGFFPPEERERIVNNYYIDIRNTQGDVFGIGLPGNRNVIGKNVVVGPGTINVDQTQIQKVSDPYSKALKDFSESINQQLNGRRIPDDQIRSINSAIDDLAKELESVNGKEDVSLPKQRILSGKVTEVIAEALGALPALANISSTFTPLAPFSSLIGEPVDKIIADFTHR
jgi:hypothetical protein